MTAIIDFLSNSTVQGSSGDDSMVGNEPVPNNNDLVYGHQGNDTVTSDFGLNNSTLYGGQDNDLIDASNSSALYGNMGNDVLEVFGSMPAAIVATNDALYGGQGDDLEESFFSASNVLYGNLGNDTLLMEQEVSDQVAYGGQGHDSVEQAFGGSFSALYGNQGDDFVEDFEGSGYNAAINGNGSLAAEGSSVLYGGQGNDTLAALGAGGDTMLGGLGHNLYAANALLGNQPFGQNDLITVEGFQTGNDLLSLSSHVNAQVAFPSSNGFLTKEEDTSANNTFSAMEEANAFYAGHTQTAYLFVYGGSGAGYLFYNGDNGGTAVSDGMILEGANAENSLQPSDVVASNFATT